jgi:hypothetical protein
MKQGACNMDMVTQVVEVLRAEKRRIDSVITELQSIYNPAPEPRLKLVHTGMKKGTMTTAGRRKLSRLMKARWASGEMKRAISGR